MRPLSFPHIISLICLLCGSLLVTPYHVSGCSLSRLSFASLDDLFFSFSVAWRSGREGRAVIGHFECEEKLPSPLTFLNFFSWFLYILNYTFISVHRCRLQAAVTFQTVTLLVLFTPWRSHYEGHSLSPWGPCECLKVLILHIQQSIQQAFFCFRNVCPSCTYQQNNAQYKRLYATFYRSLSEVFFYSCKSWQGKNQNQRKKNLHVYLIQREVKKTSSELGGRVDEWLSFSRFEKRYTTIAQDVSWQMMHSLPRWPKTKVGIEKGWEPGHRTCSLIDLKRKKKKGGIKKREWCCISGGN